MDKNPYVFGLLVSVFLGHLAVVVMLWYSRFHLIFRNGLGGPKGMPGWWKGILERLLFTPITAYNETVGIAMMMFLITAYTAINWKHGEKDLMKRYKKKLTPDQKLKVYEELRGQRRASFFGSLVSMLFVLLGAYICGLESQQIWKY